MNVSVGPGRGSAAGSAVAYCIGITNVDPIKYDLLFERFLNPDRVSLPDIDIDFDDVGRSKIIDYVIDKYGKTQVAQIITYGTMAAKSSIRDAGRVLDLPLPDTDRIAKLIPEGPGISLTKALKEVNELNEIKKLDSLEGRTLQQAVVIEGSVRNTGIHACGVIITPSDITELIPVGTSKDSDLLVTQYDNSVVEDAGLLKMDFLGLKTLTIIKDAIEIVRARTGIQIDPDEIPLDDPKTYELYQKGETNGTFQFESAGMQKHLRNLKPDTFLDLIAMNALYRPGPLEYIPNFIARKHGKEEITYDLPEMEGYLKETYGITVYQEQVMLLSQKLANFSKGDADLLRKAMGKKIKALLDQLKPQFIEGCKSNGHDEKIAEKIWKDWEAFAAYAFNKSHSTCYSVVAFQTAYLKANYPAEYMAAVLTNNMNDIKKVTFFMEECKRSGIEVLGPDINESYYKFAVNPKGQVRFGLGAIKGLGGAAVESIINERKENGKYSSIFDVVRRIDLRSANKKAFESLTYAGAFDSFSEAKRSQYFHEEPGSNTTFLERIVKYGNAHQQSLSSAQASLFGEGSGVEMPEPTFPRCEEWGTIHRLSKEKEVVGVYISGHPLDDYKLEIKNFCNSEVADINNITDVSDREITMAAIVTDVNHRMTKTGKPFGIFTIEDYNDSAEIVLFSNDYVNFKNYLNHGWFLYLKGRFQKKYYRDDEFEFKIQQIELLQELRTKLAKSFLIRVNLSKLTEEYVDNLTNLFATNRGNCQLKVMVVDEEEEVKITMPSKNVRINPSNELIEDLEKMEIPFRLYQ
jgi:DNA polymerase-3 subunit alpha